jgi:hypothetical protein
MQAANSMRGFFTIAQNTKDVDYIKLAYGLALSLKHSQSSISQLSIGVTPGTTVDRRYRWAFDQIIEIPWGDNAAEKEWKLENEWKSIWMSPYNETIKLDCDMLFFSDIQQWWQNLSTQSRPLVCANNVLDWRGNVIYSDYCRKVFTENKLPNIYTSFMYFKKTQETYEFFELAKLITWNWQLFFEAFLEPKTRPEYFSTDVAFALALKILDLDQTSVSTQTIPTFTHMKSQLQGWNTCGISDNWQEHIPTFLTPTGSLKIGNHLQVYPLHYHIKEFLTNDIIQTFENLVKK